MSQRHHRNRRIAITGCKWAFEGYPARTKFFTVSLAPQNWTIYFKILAAIAHLVSSWIRPLKVGHVSYAGCIVKVDFTFLKVILSVLLAWSFILTATTTRSWYRSGSVNSKDIQTMINLVNQTCQNYSHYEVIWIKCLIYDIIWIIVWIRKWPSLN